MHRKLSLVALFVALAMVFSIAGVSLAAEKVELNIWFMPNGPKPMDIMKAELNVFQKQHPNITVKATLLDWGSAWTKITTAATSGVGPDVLQLGTTWVGAISAMGALLPLNSYFKETEAKNFLPAAWETSHVKGSKEITAIPWFVDTRAPFYRTDVFKQLGIDPKEAFKNWDTLAAALQKIKDANLTIDKTKIEPLGVPGKNDWNVIHNFAPWIWGAGGDYLTADATKSAIDTEGSMAGVLAYIELANKGLIPRSALELNTAQTEENFTNGMYAVTFSGPWLVKKLTTPVKDGGNDNTITAKNFAVVEFPAGPKGRYVFFGGSDLSVMKSTKHKKEAVELVQFLASNESQVRYTNGIGMLPTRVSALNADWVTKNPNMMAFKRQTSAGRSYPVIAGWGPIESVLMKRLGIVWDQVAGVNGAYSADAVKQELKATAQEMNSVLAASK